MKIKWFLTGLLALIVAVGVAGVAILSTMDFEQLRGVIEAEAEKATGRKLTIAGDIDLEISLSPAIELQDVRFANADWGSRSELISVQRLELEVALVPLFSGDIQVKRLVVVAPDILLETDAEGRGNWEMPGTAKDAAPAGTAGGMTLPSIDNAVVRDAIVTYRDGKTGETMQLSFSNITLRRTFAAVPLEVALEGAYNGVPFKADGVVGLIRDLIGTTPYPVRLNFAVGGATFAIDGEIAEPVTGEGLDLKILARGQSLAELGAIAGAELPALGPYEFSAQVAQDGQSYKLTDLTAKIGDSDIAGNAALTLGGKRPAFSGDFTAANLNLADLAPGGGKAAAPAPAGEQRYVFTEDPLPFDGLKAADAKIKLNAKRLVLSNGLAFTELEVSLSLQGGKLAIEPFSAGFSGGTLAGSVSLDAGKKTPPLAVKLSADGIDYGALLQALEVTDGITGSLDAELDLRGAGASLRTIAAGLDGRIEVTGGAGSISNDLVQATGAGVTQMLSGWTESGSDLRLNCIVIRLPIAGGVASGEAMLLDTSAATVGGTGEIDLRDETLKLTVTPQAKQTSLLSLAVPFLIQGTLAEPKVLPDPLGTAVGAAKVAGLFINPLAAGAALIVGSETTGRNPCVAALDRPAQASGAAADQPQAEPEPEPEPEKSPVESATEGVGGVVGGALEGVGEGISEGLKSLFGN
ncbi:MAG: AsmA family protein [Alphaproteobacteria bacterium]